MKHFWKRAAALIFAAALAASALAVVSADEPDLSGYAEDTEDETETVDENPQQEDTADTEEDPGDEETGNTDDGTEDPEENTGDETPQDETGNPEDGALQNDASDGETEDDENEDENSSENETEEEITKEEEALQILSEIEALAGGYDITAGTVDVESDLEASFQTDLYSNGGGHIIGGSENYTADENEDNDTISIGAVAEGTDSIRAEHTIETTIILDSDIAADGLTITVTDETGSIVSASGKDGTLAIEDDIAGNVAEILDAVEELAVELAALEADTEIERIDQNTEIIDAASIDASVVIADLETVDGWTETDEDGNETVVEKLNYQSGMTVYLTEDQIVVINVTTSDECDKVIVTRFTIDIDETSFSSASQTDENSSAASQIVFNFGDYDGEIYIDSGFTGTIIAPNATVTVGSTSTGQVVAAAFSNPGGEWHGTGEGSNSSSSPQEDGDSKGSEDEDGESPAPGDETSPDGPHVGEDEPKNGTPENDNPSGTDGEDDTPGDDDENESSDEEDEPSDGGNETPGDDEDETSDEEDESSGEEDDEASCDENETSDNEEDETSENSEGSSDNGNETSSGSGESSGNEDTDTSDGADESVTDTGTETHEEYGNEDDSNDGDEDITDTGTETHTEEGRDGYTGDSGFGPWLFVLAAACAALAVLLVRVKKRTA